MLKLVPNNPVQRRNDVRVEVPRFPGEVWSAQVGKSVQRPGVVLNLSGSGALVALAQPVPVGSAVQCRFCLPDGRMYSVTAAVVREEAQAAVRRGAWVGLQFDIRADASERLVHWIFSELARQRRQLLDGAVSARSSKP